MSYSLWDHKEMDPTEPLTLPLGSERGGLEMRPNHQALGLREARVGGRGTSWAVSALCLILTANLRCLSWVIIADCGSEWPLETCYQQVGSKDSRWFQR